MFKKLFAYTLILTMVLSLFGGIAAFAAETGVVFEFDLSTENTYNAEGAPISKGGMYLNAESENLEVLVQALDIMYATATKTLSKEQVKWKDSVVGCLVLASGGYPGSYEKGKAITGLKDVNEDIIVFHAGTAFKNNEVVTSGGRVLNICAEGKSVEEVRQKIYAAAEKIDFEGKYYRTDIGLV